jgi:hypothetical protein
MLGLQWEAVHPYSYNDRQPQHLGPRIGQAKHAMQRIRRDTWDAHYGRGIVGSSPRPSLGALFSCAPRNTTRSAHVALARKVPCAAGAIRGETE